jgi:AcrR family transcriptional regulator
MRTALTRAERQAETRSRIIDAAERQFSGRGFHATSIDAVADAAGFTKGAVYSNFDSKEDLFFAVYERRVNRFLDRVKEVFDAAGSRAEAILQIVREVEARRRDDDGWLAVFLEFWTYVLRHPEHRERFAAIHARVHDPFVSALEQLEAERGTPLPIPPRQLSIAMFAMTNGLGLEQLTQPDALGEHLSLRMQQLWHDALAGGSLDQDRHPEGEAPHAPSG